MQQDHPHPIHKSQRIRLRIPSGRRIVGLVQAAVQAGFDIEPLTRKVSSAAGPVIGWASLPAPRRSPSPRYGRASQALERLT